jgi:hypothetical protein
MTTNEPKATLEFTGPYHIVEDKHGIWVDGEGLHLSVETIAEGQELIRELEEDADGAVEDYLGF